MASHAALVGLANTSPARKARKVVTTRRRDATEGILTPQMEARPAPETMTHRRNITIAIGIIDTMAGKGVPGALTLTPPQNPTMKEETPYLSLTELATSTLISPRTSEPATPW
jgi:hypothetical protein